MNESEKNKKETKQEKLNRLYRQLHEKDKEFEKAKGNRFIITMLVFTAFYFVILMIGAGFSHISSVLEAISSNTIIDILGIAIASILLAWFHILVNATIFGQLSKIGRREREVLDGIRSTIKDTETNIDN